MKTNKILILGVTAVGKGGLAFELAKQIGAEIISIDSMKVYRRMDIGTAKPSPQRRSEVKYHLLDVVEPSESFSVARFLELADIAVKEIESAGKTVIAAGGTAMYIKAMLWGLFEGPGTDENIRQRLKEQIATEGAERLYNRLAEIDPAAAGRIHRNDEKRIVRAMEVYELTGKPISLFQQQLWSENQNSGWTVIGLRRDKNEESRRINLRVKKMMQDGLVDEVKRLLAEEKPLSDQARCAIGYAEIIEHLEGKTGLEDAVEKIKIKSRRLAKAQRTWFKTFGNVKWLDIEAEERQENILKRAIEVI